MPLYLLCHSTISATLRLCQPPIMHSILVPFSHYPLQTCATHPLCSPDLCHSPFCSPDLCHSHITLSRLVPPTNYALYTCAILPLCSPDLCHSPIMLSRPVPLTPFALQTCATLTLHSPDLCHSPIMLSRLVPLHITLSRLVPLTPYANGRRPESIREESQVWRAKGVSGTGLESKRGEWHKSGEHNR